MADKGANADRVALRYCQQDDFDSLPGGELLATAIAAVAATNKFTAAAGLDAFKENQLIETSGFTNAANNGYFHVASASATELVVKETGVIVDESSASRNIKTAMHKIRFTGESLEGTNDAVESQEIRDDRQIPDRSRVGIGASGDLNFELSYETYDDFFKAAFQAASWSAVVDDISSDTGIAAVASGNKYTGGDGDFTNYAVGQWVLVAGFTNSENNGLAKITSIDSSNPGVADDDELVVSHKTLVDESAGNSIDITMGAQIVNGVADQYFVLERDYTDLTSPEVPRFESMTPEGFNLSVVAGSIITGAFNFMGKKETSPTPSSSIATGTPKDAPTYDVMNAVANVTGIFENGTTLAVTQIDLSLVNNARERLQVATLGSISMGFGRVNVTGSFQAYFKTSTQMDKVLSYSDSTLAFAVTDNSGNIYVIELPRVKLESGSRPAGGTNTDIIQNIGFGAIRNSSEDVTIRMVRFSA